MHPKGLGERRIGSGAVGVVVGDLCEGGFKLGGRGRARGGWSVAFVWLFFPGAFFKSVRIGIRRDPFRPLLDQTVVALIVQCPPPKNIRAGQ